MKNTTKKLVKDATGMMVGSGVLGEVGKYVPAQGSKITETAHRAMGLASTTLTIGSAKTVLGSLGALDKSIRQPRRGRRKWQGL